MVNLEKIRCIITAEEVLLLNTPDPAVAQVRTRQCGVRVQRAMVVGEWHNQTIMRRFVCVCVCVWVCVCVCACVRAFVPAVQEWAAEKTAAGRECTGHASGLAVSGCLTQIFGGNPEIALDRAPTVSTVSLVASFCCYPGLHHGNA